MAMVLLCSPLTALAESSNAVNTEKINIADLDIKTQLNIDNSKPAINLSSITSKIKTKTGVKKSVGISALAATTAETITAVGSTVFLQNNPRLITDGVVTENSDNYVFFTVTKDTFIMARIASNNSDYTLNLYKIDNLTDEALPTDIVINSNDTLALNGLQKGDYLFKISSNGTAGDPYSLQINATNPAGAIDSMAEVSSTLQYLVFSYQNYEVYANGIYVFSYDPTVSASHLNWTRDNIINSPGVIHERKLSIGNVKVRTFSGPVAYESDYASSDSAILLYLNEGTAFSTFESTFIDEPFSYTSSFNDVNGKATPRFLDSSDFTSSNHILVFDLNTGKVIDFLSDLNYYYHLDENGASVEPVPTITPIN